MKPTIIKPRKSFGVGDIIEMLEFRWVLFMLMWRDIKLRYKQTSLGVLWVVFQPLMTAILLTNVFGRWLNIPSGGAPYMLFSFCGLIPWLVFSQSVNRAGTSLLSEASLVQKVYFPRLFLPIAGTLGVAVDYCIGLVTFAVLMLIYGYPPTWKLLFLPCATLHLFVFSSSFNILLSGLSAHYRDFKHMLPFLLQFWMYASPLAYSTASIPQKWLLLFSVNPLTGLIEVFRWALLGQKEFPILSFSISCITTFVIGWVSIVVFRKLEKTLSDVL